MLNVQQQDVVAHGHGPALVLAGAGCGKTAVLVHRIAAMIEHEIDPQQILMITFTRRAAAELKNRITAMVGTTMLQLPWCGTFHSIAARLLRNAGHHIGIDGAFTILDTGDAQALLGNIIRQNYSAEVRQQLPTRAMLLRIHSYWRNTMLALEDVLAQHYPASYAQHQLLASLFKEYAARKHANHALDFDDLLHGWIALAECPASTCAQMFTWILVDEYQDTNPLQARILQALTCRNRNLMVVGDDAQAIYSFRGATVANLRMFTDTWNDAIVLPLQQNYRSTQAILTAANKLISEADGGFGKQLFTITGGDGQLPAIYECDDEYDQAERVWEMVMTLERNGLPLHEQAVLFRSGIHSFKLEVVLQRQGLAFRKVGGQRFAEAAHIKDVVAFLRCRQNRYDETAWQRILALLPGIGQTTAARWYAAIAAATTPDSALAKLKFPPRAEPLRQSLLQLMALLFAEPGGELGDEVMAIIDFYEPLLPVLFDNPEERQRELHELASLANQYNDRQSLLDDIGVGDDSIRSAAADAGEQLTLSTIHSAKGCEWAAVHIIQLCDDALPALATQINGTDPQQLEEERRLLYVAMTRARQQLYMYLPRQRQRRHHQSGSSIVQLLRPSRFLSPALRACCQSQPGQAEQLCDSDYIYEYDPANW